MARTGDNPQAEESADETIEPIGPVVDSEDEREAAAELVDEGEEQPTDG